jgi:hypothetical protein
MAAARAIGENVPTSVNSSSNLAVRRCMVCRDSESHVWQSIEQRVHRVQARWGRLTRNIWCCELPGPAGENAGFGMTPDSHSCTY